MRRIKVYATEYACAVYTNVPIRPLKSENLPEEFVAVFTLVLFLSSGILTLISCFCSGIALMCNNICGVLFAWICSSMTLRSVSVIRGFPNNSSSLSRLLISFLATLSDILFCAKDSSLTPRLSCKATAKISADASVIKFRSKYRK